MSNKQNQFVRVQAMIPQDAYREICDSAERERTSLSSYIRQALALHIQGAAVIHPVRLALADAANEILNRATLALDTTGEKILAEVRAEREETRRQIEDFVSLLSTFVQSTDGPPAPASPPPSIRK